MAKQKATDEEIIRSIELYGVSETARMFDINERNLRRRRKSIEQKLDIVIIPNKTSEINTLIRQNIELENGIVLIGSDAHYWPDEITAAHRGFVHLSKELKPEVIVLNGDMFDGARVSRHGRIGWSQSPTVNQELEAVQERVHEILMSSPKSKVYWNFGNHDFRLETFLSNKVGEIEDLPHTRLSDFFPQINFQISLWINNDIVIKHRFKGGTHATHNNTMWSGKTMVTGHLHSLKVTPFTDYNGTRWGVDTGTISRPVGVGTGSSSLEYNEDNPQNHRSGFAVLTIADGKLLPPELVHVIDDETICFRGKLIKV